MTSKAITLAKALEEIRMEMAAAMDRNRRGELNPRQAQRTFAETHRKLARIERLTRRAA